MENKLEKLIGKIVTAQLPFKEIIGVVIGVNIEDFYFYEKQEPIYITINLMPLDIYKWNPKKDKEEEWQNVPLNCITLNEIQ
jgi:hypothetical protein